MKQLSFVILVFLFASLQAQEKKNPSFEEQYSDSYDAGAASAIANIIPRLIVDVPCWAVGSEKRINKIEEIIFHGEPILTPIPANIVETWKSRFFDVFYAPYEGWQEIQEFRKKPKEEQQIILAQSISAMEEESKILCGRDPYCAFLAGPLNQPTRWKQAEAAFEVALFFLPARAPAAIVDSVEVGVGRFALAGGGTLERVAVAAPASPIVGACAIPLRPREQIPNQFQMSIKTGQEGSLIRFSTSDPIFAAVGGPVAQLGLFKRIILELRVSGIQRSFGPEAAEAIRRWWREYNKYRIEIVKGGSGLRNAREHMTMLLVERRYWFEKYPTISTFFRELEAVFFKKAQMLDGPGTVAARFEPSRAVMTALDSYRFDPVLRFFFDPKRVPEATWWNVREFKARR